jgi:hypothetical protein
MAGLIVEKQKTTAAIFSLLSEEQKVKAAEMHQKMTDRRGHRRGHKSEITEE